MNLGRWTVLATLALGSGVAACSDDDSGSGGITLTPVDGSTTTSQPTDDAAGSGAESLTGSWEGTYECAAGETALTLAIDDRGEGGEGEVAASFAFGPVAEGSGSATSRYSLEGTVTAGKLALTGQAWQEPVDGDQPMPGLEAEVADRPDTEHIEGTVVGDGCSTFSVDRVSTAPWYSGTFRGAYGCNQGVTGLDLTVEDLGDRAVEATYDFYAVPENPDVPSGSYRMDGSYVDGEMVLTGAEWIDQPRGYVMVDLRIFNDLGIDPNRLYGSVVGSGGTDANCSIFGLDRVEAPA